MYFVPASPSGILSTLNNLPLKADRELLFAGRGYMLPTASWETPAQDLFPQQRLHSRQKTDCELLILLNDVWLPWSARSVSSSLAPAEIVAKGHG